LGFKCIMDIEKFHKHRACGDLSVLSLVERSLERIRTLDGEHGAWVHVADKDALLQLAADSDARWTSGTPLSALDGLPFSVKDSQHVVGMPTTFGSLAATPVLPTQSSPIVERLQKAGAIALGKTSLPEFSWKGTTESPRSGITRNPRYPHYSPGGSSGGAAVSIAQGACLLATGTDAAGSVRIPAAFTGTVGFKPSDSIALSTGAVEGFKRIGHWGVHTRTLADLARVWNTLYDSAAAPEQLRWASIDTSTRMGSRAKSFYDACVARMVKRFGPPAAVFRPDWVSARQAIHSLYLRGCFETFSRIDSLRIDLVDPGLADFANRGALVNAHKLAQAIDAQVMLRSMLDQIFEVADVLVLPTVAFDPPLIGKESPEEAGVDDWIDWAHCTYLTNLTGHPSLSLPWELEGVPFGLQVVGLRGRDAQLLAASEQINRLMGTE
jgi:Asp-tRNA(Asn)/Glu-tRNA(Gln) amidotransferase A subunit family amidase